MWGQNETLIGNEMKAGSFSSLLVIKIGKTDQHEDDFVKETNIHGYITYFYGKEVG